MYDVLIGNIYKVPLVAPYVRYVRTSDGFIRNSTTGVYAANTAWANSMHPLVELALAASWGFENLERNSTVPITIQFFDGAAGDATDTAIFFSSNNVPSNIAY